MPEITFHPATLSIVWIPDVRILREDGIISAPITQRVSVFGAWLPLFPWIRRS